MRFFSNFLEARRELKESNEVKFHSHSFPVDMPEIQENWNTPITEASLLARASVLMRFGQLDLESGTGAFHVNLMLRTIGDMIGVRVRPNVMLTTLEASFSDGNESRTEIIELPTVSTSTRRVWYMEYATDWLAVSLGKPRVYDISPVERFLDIMPAEPEQRIPTVGEILERLEKIEYASKPYTFTQHGIAAAVACASFAFLLGGGIYDVVAAFLGAFAGQTLRSFMQRRHYTQYATTAFVVLLAGFVAIGFLRLASFIDPSALSHDTAYIGAMLFALPSFPFITGGMDVAKLDYLSAVQRWTHSLVVMVVATMAAWGVAATINLNPEEFVRSDLPVALLIAMRFAASFTGVFFYSLMVNSHPRMALVSAGIAAIANTIRLELIDFTPLVPAAAAFVAATLVGLLATLWKKLAEDDYISQKLSFPHHALTIPAIAIMVPGFYMYQAMYNLGSMHIDLALDWIFRAAMVAIALPAGLAFSRFLSARRWRYEL